MNKKIMFAGLMYVISLAISAPNTNEIGNFQSDQYRIDDLKIILEDARLSGQKVFVEEFTGLS